jgi:nitrogen fixation-related uncharacterized protein
MSIIFLLIPLGIVLMALAIWGFFWAVGDGSSTTWSRRAGPC